MGRSQETFQKKEKEKNKQKKRLEKEQRREERRNNAGGKTFEEMIMYVDENGQFTSTPPDRTKRKEINAEDIQMGAAKREENESEHTGRVSFFNFEKGYGFIKEDNSSASIFVHQSALEEAIKENDRVSYQTEMGPKGLMAVNIRIIK